MATNFRKKKNTAPVMEGSETGSENLEVVGLSQGQIIRKRFFQLKPAVA